MADDTMRSEFPDHEQRAAVCHRQMDAGAALSAAAPIRARLLRRNPNGSALIEVPVLTIQDKVDFSRSHGGGPKDGRVSESDLQEMAANFPHWPQPITIGFDGIDGGHDRNKAGPQSAFAVSARYEAGALMVVAELDAATADLIVDRRAYRATSVEARKSPSTPTVSLEGWVLTGFIFTNQNAVDTVFDIAASGTEITSEDALRSLGEFHFKAPNGGQGVDRMEQNAKPQDNGAETVSLSFHRSELAKQSDTIAAREGEVGTLKAALSGAEEKLRRAEAALTESNQSLAAAKDESATATAKANRLEVENKNLRSTSESLQVALTEKEQQLRSERNVNLSAKVKSIVETAVQAGVAPAFFDGYEQNPAEWMESQYASVEAFENQVQRLTSLATGKATIVKPVRSGHDPAKAAGDAGDELTEDERRLLSKYGGHDFAFGDVTTEAEARKRFAARKNRDKE
jgi:hypothetical protein